ncbi:hypothetical protein H6P81_014549 [Aristolochia fimbriata]|uniref:non-specific serine/threonine protein kinase n=1 Tax=Aristolochia fimbriata TaxID=158543 RepID=A0AAV7EKM2_ARIFI|nr:hypothetical protein H6P81_014549 [Aristolochia fimbriata]
MNPKAGHFSRFFNDLLSYHMTRVTDAVRAKSTSTTMLIIVASGGSSGVEAGRIQLGRRLSARESNSWLSDNGTFAFGFAPTPGSSHDQFQLAIWYASLPGDLTIVWSANRNVPVGKDASVELDGSGNLVLSDRNTLVWSSNTSGQGVEFAVISDSGNFALYGASDDLRPVWDTFAHPSDTILPGQSLTVSQELTTPKSGTHDRRGYYSLKMLQQPTSLSLALTYNSPKSEEEGSSSSFPPESPYSNYSYWSSPEISNVTGDVVAVLDQSGNFGIMYGSDPAGKIYVYKNDGTRNHSSSSSSQSSSSAVIISRVTIESNGNLRLYRWGEVNGSYQWIPDWAAVSNPCMIAGICGNGVCTLKGSKSNTSCTCLPGTSPVPPSGECVSIKNSSNSSPPPGYCDSRSRRSGTNYGGGINNNASQKFKMVAMQQTTYYFSGASVIANYSDISTGAGCGQACLSDCQCVASVYGLSEEKTYCWTLRSLVFGGLQDPSSSLFVKAGENTTGIIDGGSLTPKGGDDDGSPTSGPSSSTRQKVVVIPIVVCMSVLVGLLCLLLYYYNMHKYSSGSSDGNYSGNTCHVEGRLMVPGAPRNFAYRDLQIATSNFSQMLGTGGFGSVYKGSLTDGTLVAVKKLERILPHGEKEFVTEVTTIGSMHHMNLVRLCGFCSERTHRLLVYEFMSKGSLDKWIFSSYSNRATAGENGLLDWKTRFQIAIGTAQGIAYFHEQCRNRIIHCDIKPENILLDDNFCPKISDFGLAKLMGREHSNVVTMVRGTRGYLAPEWVSNRPITVKADVYSYGMLLLEMVGGRRNVDMSLDAEDFFYPGWAFKEMMKGNALNVADKRLKGKVVEEEVVRAMKVAFWCIQEEVWMRPSMGEVVKMLEGSVEMHTPPMPQSVVELVEEGLDHVYRAMRREFKHQYYYNSSFTANSNTTSQATCSYSTMSPR